MRGYGRDYDNRNWVDRAEDTVRGWFGGGRDYDRDYGWSGSDRDTYRGDWSRGPDRARPGEGYRTNNWNNQHANWDTVDRAGSYYGMDYQDRQVYRAAGDGYDRGTGYDRGAGYDRDFGRDRMQGGGHRWMEGLMGGSMEPRGGTDRGMTGGGMDRGMYGRGMPDRPMRGTGRDTWTGTEYGGGYGASPGSFGASPGGYGRGGTYGGGGRYFRGYGVGGTGGSGYEPY
jgi:hypothetical protein